MTRRAAPQSGVDRMVSTSWSGRRWSSPAARRGRALARGLEGRLPLQHHHVSDQNSSSSRCRASFSVALKHGIYRDSLSRPHMGRFGSRDEIIRALIILQRLFRYPRSEPDCTTWSFPRQINLTFGRLHDGCTNIPLAAGGAQEDETILEGGFLSHAKLRFVHLDPPGLMMWTASPQRHHSAKAWSLERHIEGDRP